MATIVAMPHRRVALGELKPSRYNKINKNAALDNAGTTKAPAPSNNFNVPSSKFNFTSTIKRSFELYEDEDRENVDPAEGLVSGKKARGLDGEAVKPHVPHFNLTTIKEPAIFESTKIARSTLGVKPRASASTKPSGLASRARLAGKRVVRANPQGGATVNPPSVAKAHVTVNPPVSTSMPLNGALVTTAKATNTSVKDRLSTLRKGRKSRNGQDFTIHEDTPFDEMANLMEHSTHTLDISDDEKSGKFRDESDKENIPPPGCPASAVRPIARRDMMTEEVRSPLVHLEASLYYAPGCDTNSVIDAPQEPLPGSELLDLEFGSIDGELLGDIKSKLSKVEDAVESVADNTDDAVCKESNIA
ncbi:MAG: hypothetical protein Q9201_007724 [Fulgogasparrea decipioides]